MAIEAQTADLPCVFSSDVTSEVGLLQTTQFLSRQASTEEWGRQILKAKEYNTRKNRAQEIKEAGYDIEEEARSLVALYEKLAR